MSDVRTLTDSEFRTLVLFELSELKKLVASPKQAQSAILTLEQAMDYLKIPGVGITDARLKAFYRWRKKHRVPARRRYSRDVLDLALARETGVVRVPASMRRAS